MLYTHIKFESIDESNYALPALHILNVLAHSRTLPNVTVESCGGLLRIILVVGNFILGFRVLQGWMVNQSCNTSDV